MRASKIIADCVYEEISGQENGNHALREIIFIINAKIGDALDDAVHKIKEIGFDVSTSTKIAENFRDSLKGSFKKIVNDFVHNSDTLHLIETKRTLEQSEVDDTLARFFKSPYQLRMIPYKRAELDLT